MGIQDILNRSRINELTSQLQNITRPQVSGVAAEVNKEYQAEVGDFLGRIPDVTLCQRVKVAADKYFRSCAVAVWANGKPASDTMVSVYNEGICSEGAQPGSALFFEVSSLVQDSKGFQVPVFYSDLLTYDQENGTKLAERFAKMTEALMLEFARIDGELSDEEEKFVADCVSGLNGYQPGEDRLVQEVTRSQQSLDDLNAAMDNLLNNLAANLHPVDGTAAPRKEVPAQSAPEQKTEAKAEEKPAEPEKSLDELLAELDELCGLDQVKKDVRSLINLCKVRKLRQENNLPVPPMSLHLVFLGNPGTGKTTVARLLAKLYHAIGVLPKGQLVEVDRSGLVAGYVGQTAQKTQEVIKKALGGVLFIDEAYALTSQKGENDFGKEAVEVLLKNMEDHRDELIVIVAGYSGPMNDFIHSNPGLESRFNKYFYFEDYTGEQLTQIFLSQCRRNSYTPDEELNAYLPEFFNKLFEERDENFGNAREVRNIFETMISVQSDRVSQLENPTVDDLMAFTLADFKKAVQEENEEGEQNS